MRVIFPMDHSFGPDIKFHSEVYTSRSCLERACFDAQSDHRDRGLAVCSMAPDGPAAKSGEIELGDVLIAVNGARAHTSVIEISLEAGVLPRGSMVRAYPCPDR
jgi:C-terminal processing protease CtpA/Prc